jgi:two-component system cell cycle sensor histidine kinase/response regulator CckA
MHVHRLHLYRRSRGYFWAVFAARLPREPAAPRHYPASSPAVARLLGEGADGYSERDGKSHEQSSEVVLPQIAPEGQPDFQNALLESIPGGWALILKKNTREIVAFNTLAREAGAAIGETCYRACAGLDGPCAHCMAPVLWETGEPQQIGACDSGKWYECAWAPLTDDLYVHYVFDITDGKRTEEELRSSEKQLSSIYRAVGDAIFQVAIEPGRRYRFVSINPAFTRITGLSPEMVVGQYVNDVIPEPSLSMVLANYQKAIDEGTVERWEEVSNYPTGTLTGDVTIAPIYDSEGSCTHLVGAVHDITEQKHAHERLQLTQFSVDHAIDSVYWADSSASLMYVSDSMCVQLGYSKDELLGMTLFDINPVLRLSEWEVAWEQLRQQGAMAMETTHQKRDGSTFPVEVNLNFVEYGDRAYNCVFARDVSDRKRAEAALREREEQLRQSQKMEAVGQLAGGVAHDFNNLLTAILGYSEFALSDDQTQGLRVRGDLEQIMKAAERASGLTRQILAFSRRQALRPEVTSLNTVLRGMEPLLRRTLGENIDLVTVLDANLGYCEIDVHQFEQVLMNLAVNSRDAMPAGGRLVIETGDVELGEDDCKNRPDATPGPCVALSVTDTGLGMDEVTRSRIFEPFFTTKPPGVGTGLGLSTVYGIVRQSGGSIDIVSEPGRGTAFKVYVPRVSAAELTSSRALDSKAPVGGYEKVLVVEDEEALRLLVTRILENVGYTVLGAGTANEALELLAKPGVVADALLTDVVLPGGLQGNDLAQVLLSRNPKLPVLYMSGYTRDATLHSGRSDERPDFIGKPFTPQALASALRRVIDQARA